MPNITITNISSAQVFLSDFYKTLGPAEVFTVFRSAADLSRLLDLENLMESGVITIDYDTAEDEGVPGISGGSVYPDGVRLHGIIDGDVVVHGSAVVAGPLTINGDLYTEGSLTNPGGNPVTINGDVTVRGQANFTTDDPTAEQGDVRITGSFSCDNTEMKVNKGQSPSFYVGKDLMMIAEGNFFGQGNNSAHGLNLTVLGNCLMTAIDLSGGDTDDSSPAGDGGNMTVYGNLSITDFLGLEGGDGSNGHDAGSGGSLSAYGTSQLYASLRGGSGNQSNSGNGGGAELYGAATIYYIESSGGYCQSNDPNHRSGPGGYVYCYGDVGGEGSIDATGGSRDGSLPSHSVVLGNSSGGEVYIAGSFMLDSVNVSGGDVYLNSNPNCDGGDGGFFGCEGVGHIGNIDAGGGDNGSNTDVARRGGNAGEIRFVGCASAYDIYCNGGNGGGGTAGRGGTVRVLRGITAGHVGMNDGSGSSPATGSTMLILSGNCVIREINMDDRANSTSIQPDGNLPIALRLSILSGTKKTLDWIDSGPIQTQDISADLAGSIFLWDALTSVWFKVTGTSILV